MLVPYVLTALAGVALGVVAMRLFQATKARAPAGADASVSVETPAASVLGGIAPQRLMLIGAGVIAAAAIAIMALKPGEDDLSGLPTLSALPPGGGSAAPRGQGGLADVDTMIGKLEKRLKDAPDDAEGFRMLGWSYAMTGNPAKAIAPYERALSLAPDNARVHAGYAEALTGVAGGKVTDKARAEFEKAVRLDPADARSRYFLGQWQAQNGKAREALDAWIAIANEGPADAPWQADVARAIADTSAKLGVDVSSRLKRQPVLPATGGDMAEPPPLDPAQMEAGASLPPSQQQAMISDMVDGLAARLEANPRDLSGWARLFRSRMVMGEGERARADLARARKALSGDKAALAEVDAAASRFGVPGA